MTTQTHVFPAADSGAAITTPLDVLSRLFDLPLYEQLPVDTEDPGALLRVIRTLEFKLDRHCPSCGKSTTWKTDPSLAEARDGASDAAAASNRLSAALRNHVMWGGDFTVHLVCSRNAQHVTTLFIKRHMPESGTVVGRAQAGEPSLPINLSKVGQYPSLTDFQIGALASFEEGMSKQQRRDFVRAINCTAHGFNVAACVHYRRVFESVLFEARDEKMRSEGMAQWPEYEAMRTGERIAALRGNLPDFMVEHPHLYSILSKGVHELTEEECGAALSRLRQAIELVLSNRVAAFRVAKQRAEVSKFLAQQVDEHRKT